MTRKHKIVVTRDKDGIYCIWRPTKKLKQFASGNWDTKKAGDGNVNSDIICDQLDYPDLNTKRMFGVVLKKGSKETITIVRAKK